MEKKKFKWKSFISFGLFISFFVIAVTGIVLYITPPGRVAKWTNWELLGLTKEQWQAQHTIFSYIFLVLSLFHIFSMNWKVFISYIKKKTAGGFHLKKEFAISVVLMIFIFFGTLYLMPPFKQVVDLGEYLTESWEKKEEQAPLAHTEAMTVKELSEKLVKLSPAEIIAKLEKKGITAAAADKTLKDIAAENGTSPFELYKMITENTEQKKLDFSMLKHGSGIGRKSLTDIAKLVGGDVEEMLAKLKSAGIETTPDEKFKDIAQRVGKTPYDVVELLK